MQTPTPTPTQQVRDFSFSPDTGAISRIIYDDFGLGFLPVSFFDTYSIPMSDVMGVGPAGMTVRPLTPCWCAGECWRAARAS